MDFFDVAYSDSSEYIGYIGVVLRDKDGNFKTVKFVKRTDISEFMKSLKIYKCCDYYLTANTFTRKSRTAPLLGLNNIVLDIDAHNISEENRPELNEELQDFSWRISHDTFPAPTAIHFTGRGIQVWYHIEQVSAKCSLKVNTLIEGISRAYNAVIADNEYNFISIDRTASERLTGLYRVPETYNTKTKTKSKIELSGNKYSLEELLISFHEHLSPMPLRRTTMHSKPLIKHSESDYISLNRGRLNVLVELLRVQRQKGRREIILWLSYNALCQLYEPTKAKKELERLNKELFEPLRDTEVQSIFREIDSRTEYYKISQYEFCKMLDISESYYAEHANKRKQQRGKQRTQKQRNRSEIEKEIRAGKKYKDIAERYSVSLRTVNNIAKSLKNDEMLKVLKTG